MGVFAQKIIKQLDILAYVNHLAHITWHKSIENKAKFIPTLKTIPILLAIFLVKDL